MSILVLACACHSAAPRVPDEPAVLQRVSGCNALSGAPRPGFEALWPIPPETDRCNEFAGHFETLVHRGGRKAVEAAHAFLVVNAIGFVYRCGGECFASHVGFDRSGQFAVLFVQCPTRFEYVLLEYTGAEWNVVAREPPWFN